MPSTHLINIFVTVGSTQFDNLIDSLIAKETLQILKQLGCRKLTIQYGSYKKVSSLDFLHNWTDFEIELFDYKNSIAKNIDSADLVIGHAGAGTALEVLRKRKPLLIVINDTLMDNHQEELALDLTENNFVKCSNTSTLLDTLQSLDVTTIKPFPEQDTQRSIYFSPSTSQENTGKLDFLYKNIFQMWLA